MINEQLSIGFHCNLTQEEKTFLYILSKEIEATDEPGTKYSFYIPDMVEELGFPLTNSFHPLTELTSLLRGEVFEIRRKSDGMKIQTSWLTEVIYNEEKSFLIVGIEDELKGFLLYLKRNPELITFCAVSHLDKTVSKRLYYLMTHLGESSGVHRYTLEELYEALSINKPSYSQFGDFKRRTLDKAVQEINTKTDLSLEYTTFRTGRKVTQVIFSFQKNAL